MSDEENVYEKAIDSVASENPSEFSDIINDILINKLNSAIDIKKFSVASSFFDKYSLEDSDEDLGDEDEIV